LIWQRRNLESLFRDEYQNCFVEELRGVAYNMRDGPWRQCWVRENKKIVGGSEGRDVEEDYIVRVALAGGLVVRFVVVVVVVVVVLW